MAALLAPLINRMKSALRPSNPFSSQLPVLLESPATVIDAVPVEAVPVPLVKRARSSGLADPPNLSVYLDAERVQNALRQAERGDTRDLFTIYRDELLGYAHLQSEWLKRKSVIVGQPHALIPKVKGNADDQTAADVCSQMIDNCENWTDGLIHLLDSTLYPVSVVEKIFQPVGLAESGSVSLPVRFLLKQLYPVPYHLLCFRLPYSPQQTTSGRLQSADAASMVRGGSGYSAANPATVYDVDAWEPDLRFYETTSTGYIDYSMQNVYAPARERHIIHRGNMFSRSIRDNFGGAMRAILYWWLLATKGRDWFAVYMQKYGSPFLVGKADSSDKNTVDFLTTAFAMSTQIGGLIIDKRAEVELKEASAQDGSNAHKTLQMLCNDEVSKIVVGQVLSSSAKNTGLGSGVADLHGEVRQDIRLYDMRRLSETVKRQLFEPYLRMNGYRGHAPEILWGGEKEHEALALAQSVNQFRQAGLQPTDDGLETLGHRIGYGLERSPLPAPTGGKPI